MPIGTLADVFALTILAWRLLSGRLPFDPTNNQEHARTGTGLFGRCSSRKVFKAWNSGGDSGE